MSDLSIYVSHTRQQTVEARRLCAELTSHGYSIAINRQSIPAGARIKPALKASMAGAARCIVCFSAKPGGPAEYEQEELALAIERLPRSDEGPAWLLPVKLTACDLATIAAGGTALTGLATIDLHEDWSQGVKQLLAALPAAPSAEAVCPPAAAGGTQQRAELEATINSMQAKHIVLANLDGVKSGNGRTALSIGSMTGDSEIRLANIKR